jgi:flagellin
MIINTNIPALASANDLNQAQNRLDKSLEELSSGSQINSPADNPAGLAAVTSLNAEAQCTTAAQNNVSSALSFTQTQDGYLSGVSTALSQMSELSIEALDETTTGSDRSLYDSEFQQLNSYIMTTATKDLNGVSLFSGNTLDVTLDANNQVTLNMNGIDLSGGAYAAATSSNIATTPAAAAALTAVDAAIAQLASDRATVGAYETRLNYASDQLSVGEQNLTAASAQIEDVNVADESTEYASDSVMLQSTTAMLAQANQVPQTVLKLISG